MNRVFPVSISAMIQPTDQMSTADGGEDASPEPAEPGVSPPRVARTVLEGPPEKPPGPSLGSGPLTSLIVVHPAEDHLRGPVPAGHHVACHLCVRMPGQPEIQDLWLRGHREKELPHTGGSHPNTRLPLHPPAHLQLAILVHGQVARLQVLDERRERALG